MLLIIVSTPSGRIKAERLYLFIMCLFIYLFSSVFATNFPSFCTRLLSVLGPKVVGITVFEFGFALCNVMMTAMS